MTAIDIAPKLDQAAVEAFGDRVIGVLNDACTALMTSIGHQTGLFDALAAAGPVTSTEIARRTGLNERYVREWLKALATARILSYDPSRDRYLLPAEHAAWLTTAAGPNNLARTMQYIPLLAEVEQGIVDCFRNGGGLSYDHYPRFHALMAEDSAAVFDAALVDVIIPLVEGLPDRLRDGIHVADIGCGSGHAVNVLAQAYPASRLVGYDFSTEAIQAARSEADRLGLTNARFEVLDVATLDEPDSFDLVTAFDAVHDQAHPAKVLAAVARALRPGGVFLMVDIKASSAVRLGRERHASTAVRLHELRERCNNDHSGGRGIRTHEDGVGPALELFKSSPFGLSGSPPGYPVSHSGRGLYRPATSEAPSRSGNAPARAGGGRWRRTRCPNP
jgi:protein-L-isoaspartate O-methyltransferase